MRTYKQTRQTAFIKKLLLIFLFVSCQKEIYDPTLEERQLNQQEQTCVKPTMQQDAQIIGHITTYRPQGEIYFKPLTGVRPFYVSVDSGRTFYNNVDRNGNFTVTGLKEGTYYVCMKDSTQCLSTIFKAELQNRK